MGIDITHIIKSNFYNTENREEIIRFAHDICFRLGEFYNNPKAFEVIISCNDDNDCVCYIYSGISDIYIYIRKGFFEIESYFKYTQLFAPNAQIGYWLRRIIFDLVIALEAYSRYHIGRVHV